MRLGLSAAGLALALATALTMQPARADEAPKHGGGLGSRGGSDARESESTPMRIYGSTEIRVYERGGRTLAARALSMLTRRGVPARR